MQNDIEKLLAALPVTKPPKDLFVRIHDALEYRLNLRVAKRRMVGLVVGLVSLTGGIFVYWNVLMGELAQSSFVSYLRVIVTDSDVVAKHWQEMGMSLLESLPMANIMVWLSMAFLLCGLLYVIKQIRPKVAMRPGSLIA